jgi:hypothetical protein
MRRYFFAKLGLLALVFLTALAVMGFVVVAASAPAAAQNGTSTPEPAAGSVGPIDIESFKLEDGTMTMTLNVERPTAYALSDSLAGLDQRGVTEVPVKQGTLAEGRRRISLSVTVYEGAGAVTLSTPTGAVRVQTQPVGPDRDEVEYGTVQALTAGSALFGAGGTVWYFKRRRDAEDKEAERRL